MKKIDEIKELLKKKADNLETEDDKEKYEGIVELLSFDNVFGKMGVETGIGLLDFLGVEENKILETYVALVAEETMDETKQLSRDHLLEEFQNIF